MNSSEAIYSELPAIGLFQKLGYQFLNGSETDERNSIEEIVLIKRLGTAIFKNNPWANENSLAKAYNEITNI